MIRQFLEVKQTIYHELSHRKYAYDEAYRVFFQKLKILSFYIFMILVFDGMQKS